MPPLLAQSGGAHHHHQRHAIATLPERELHVHHHATRERMGGEMAKQMAIGVHYLTNAPGCYTMSDLKYLRVIRVV